MLGERHGPAGQLVKLKPGDCVLRNVSPELDFYLLERHMPLLVLAGIVIHAVFAYRLNLDPTQIPPATSPSGWLLENCHLRQVRRNSFKVMFGQVQVSV